MQNDKNHKRRDNSLMLKLLRQKVINNLWQSYRSQSSQLKQIEKALKQKGMHHLILDHFAIIDLPGLHSGIPFLTKLFSKIKIYILNLLINNIP